jgi:hypothetical protein
LNSNLKALLDNKKPYQETKSKRLNQHRTTLKVLARIDEEKTNPLQPLKKQLLISKAKKNDMDNRAKIKSFSHFKKKSASYKTNAILQ